MGHWLRHTAYFLVFSNIFISLCAVAFTLETYRLLNGQLSFSPFLILIFFATLFIYILQRMFPGEDPDVQYSAMQLWISQHKKLLWALSGFSLLIAGSLFFTVPRAQQMLLVMIAVITLAYSFPLLIKLRLRDLGAIKYLFIALVWSLTTVLLPALHLEHSLLSKEVLWLLSERFVFITSITIPFDIRDVKYDRQSLKNRTLPMTIGSSATKQIAYAVLLLFLMICLAHQLYIGFIGGWFIVTGLILTSGVTFLTIRNIDQNTTEFYYLFYLDGMMILQFLLVEMGWFAGKLF